MENRKKVDRTWKPEFRKYTEYIVQHPNYKGLFYERSKDGTVKWVVTGKSENGKKRLQWWDEACKKYNVPIKKGCYAVIARRIHPTGKHVCQCCGRSLSIYYEYLNKRCLNKVNDFFELNLKQTDYTIKEIIDNFCNERVQLDFIASLFDLPLNLNKEQLLTTLYKERVDAMDNRLSPGVMSNLPDRFDGFHSDGLCCREKTDLGRYRDNLATYQQDRRAYEEWADGDYNLANRLMGEFHKGHKLYKCPVCGKVTEMSADHIGPISLGFCHSKNFAAMCKSCNSSKNNRFTFSDVQKLSEIEAEGEDVVSWHSRFIWNKYKHLVKDDDSAKLLSSIMLKCHQNVLKLFSLIYSSTGKEFLLRYLHPQYSLYDIRFKEFDPLDLSKLKIIRKELDSKNKEKNQERYIRIAFESLEEFNNKNNRKTRFYVLDYPQEIEEIIKDIKLEQYSVADQKINNLIELFCERIGKEEWGN